MMIEPLESLGWRNLLPLSPRYFPSAVRHFYCNLITDEEVRNVDDASEFVVH